MKQQRPLPRDAGRRQARVVKTDPGIGAMLAWLLILVAIGGACYLCRGPILRQIREAVGNAPSEALPSPTAAPAPVVVKATPTPAPVTVVMATPKATPHQRKEIVEALPTAP